MKKIIAFVFATSLAVCVISCGPSEKEKKADSVQFDSTKKEMHSTEDHMIDSMNAANDAATKAQHKADSIKADSIAKAKKKK